MGERMNSNQELVHVRVQPSDIINTLPDHVTETILMYLPTRDAVRTSILSKKWRYRWTKVPQLIFDKRFWNKLTVTHSANTTFMSILCSLLFLHKGPIYKFTLSIPGLKSCPEIDILIIFLIRNGIKDLTIKMPYSECYRLPLSFSKCQQLEHLNLEYCLIETTPALTGFGKLITLKLNKVTISSQVLKCLISNSPLLEVLELENSSNSYDLEIDFPNLKSFKFKGFIQTITFIKAPLLASFSIFQYARANKILFNGEGVACNLDKFFYCLPVLTNLHLQYSLIKFLSHGGVPRRLNATIVFLKHITFSYVTLDSSFDLSIILCLLRNTPNLKSVDIEIFIYKLSDTHDSLEILTKEENSDVMLNKLEEVKLNNITGTIVELEFIKLLLAKSPGLQKMLIHPGKMVVDKECKILTEVNKFSRASKDVKVIYEHK